MTCETESAPSSRRSAGEDGEAEPIPGLRLVIIYNFIEWWTQEICV